MSEKPILFSAEMVKAILDGRKTMTRRIVKNKAFQQWLDVGMSDEAMKNPDNNWVDVCPWQPGDVLWVRETWCKNPVGSGYPYCYKASEDSWIYDDMEGMWKPSIHMPRKVARLFLRVKNVRVERLQDITEEDAGAEGLQDFYGKRIPYISNITRFSDYWDTINSKSGYGWDVNPYVFVVEFERLGEELHD